MKTQTNTEKSRKEKTGRARWLRTALLTYTLAGPAIRSWIKRRASDGSQAVTTAAQTLPEVVQSRQADLRERLEELTRESRQKAIEQAQHLRNQATQFQAQARQLRKALRKEAKQRRKLLAQMRESGVEWGQDMLKRGERLTGELVERGEEITHDLAKRGRKLAKQTEKLLPTKEQNRVVWMAAGFGVGLVIAGAITYRLVRNRAFKQALLEEEQSYELPESEELMVATHPAGEIVHVDQNGTTVTKLETVTVANAERPENAAYVGVISTQSYYPVDTELEPTDVVYFVTEEEAKARGFRAAE
jgi:ribosome recycling factor